MKINLTTEPIIVENKDFQTIQIRVLFPFEENEKDLAKISLLPSMLMYLNSEYDTEDKFQKEKKKNYILGTSCSKFFIGTSGFLCFNMIIPDFKILGTNLFEEQLSFFSKMIYSPKIINGGFSSFEVEREKKNLMIGIKNSTKDLRSYQSIKSLEYVDDIGILSRCIENHSEQIELVTSQNLYNFYKDIVYKTTPLIFIMGDVVKDEISDCIDKYLYKNKDKEISFNKNYNYFLKPRKKNINIIEEKSTFKDSSISLFYKVYDMSEDDILYLELIKILLTSLSSRLLSKKLRDEFELVYSTKVVSYTNFGLLEITAFINKKNKDISIEKIKEVIEELKDAKLVTPLLKNVVERVRITLIKSLDNKHEILTDFITSKLEIAKTTKEKYELLKNVTASDVAMFVDRLVLDTIYFIEEEENNENR